MTNRNDNFENAKLDDMDRAVDTALARYAAVEPRPGLEERILASLRTEQTKAESRAWWKWGMAAAVAAIVIATALAWRPSRPAHPVIAKHHAIPTSPDAPIRLANRDGTSSPTVKKLGVRRPVSKRSRTGAVAATDPKLDQFPSPEPLTDEERALIQYVRQFPGEAMTIAQAQEDFEKEIQQQSKATPDSSSSDSER